MNLNELTYVASLAAEKLFPGDAPYWQWKRDDAARFIRDGLLALQHAGWTFTATEPGGE